MGGGSLSVDYNPLNYFPQNKRHNVLPSAWTHAETIMKKVMGYCGDRSDTCYASAKIDLEYKTTDKWKATTTGTQLQPKTNPYMPFGGQYTIWMTPEALKNLLAKHLLPPLAQNNGSFCFPAPQWLALRWSFLCQYSDHQFLFVVRPSNLAAAFSSHVAVPVVPLSTKISYR